MAYDKRYSENQILRIKKTGPPPRLVAFHPAVHHHPVFTGFTHLTMITIAKIDNDIARIEALMMLGSDSEKKKLAKVRDQCKMAKDLFSKDWVKEHLVKSNLSLAQNKMSAYLKHRIEINKICYANEKDRTAALKMIEKDFNPVKLSIQIRFALYLLGEVEIIDDDLLTSLSSVSETQKHANQKRSSQ
ncbi:hypothetical protein [Haliscomenobacter hydrossis]|uniref:Uncharacterized protein n=1 Tax=Haliscomenobacter hydrossis (strain ATCC 27775 / DSM 1100 / LMG 10767 / O) TaxID=760192 RepID=F4L080_HALH1|nr:hypothetical protein [Haliscomenobacter hydrossis]AEE53753.1 hypothetical protein Halhy_5930 [Haliscomenobacter hydrossis DSM 1100]